MHKNEEAFSHTISIYFWSLQVFIQKTYLLKLFLKKKYGVLHSTTKMDYIISTCSQCYGLFLIQLQCLLCCLVIQYFTAMLLGYVIFIGPLYIFFVIVMHKILCISLFTIALNIHNNMNSSYRHLSRVFEIKKFHW